MRRLFSRRGITGALLLLEVYGRHSGSGEIGRVFKICAAMTEPGSLAGVRAHAYKLATIVLEALL
jgi:hypothetical protein